MVLKEVQVDRPDGILLVIAYFLTLGVGFVLGGLALMATAVPHALSMGLADRFFLGGAAILVLMTVFCLVLGAGTVLVARNLWRARPGARAAAVVLAAVLTLICLLSIPAWFVSYNGDERLVYVALSLLVGAGSGGSLRYLMGHGARAFYG